MAAYLQADFVDPANFILFTDKGKIDKTTYEKLGKRMSDPDKRYVLPGFYGSEKNGNIKTFPRGGSDITGSIAARAVNAELYENWTDVSGLLMADPGIVPNPKPMTKVTYREIRELAYMGANVFHDEAIAPVRDMKIPINIKNTNNPDDKGTLIVNDLGEKSGLIAGIAGKKNVSIFNIEKALMNKEKGFGRKVLGIFEEHKVSYEHSPTGIDSMNVVVLQEELQDKTEIIRKDIIKTMEPDNVTVHDDLSLIATVGEEMQQVVGTAAKLFCALRDAGVNIRIIDQGSSEINIIAGVFRKDYETAVRALYKCFVE
jgi:aspartate kinase